MGWTGGQYSLYRAGLALAVGCELLASAGGILADAGAGASASAAGGGAVGGSALLGAVAARSGAFALLGFGFLIAALLVVGLAVGFRDRIAARLLAPIVLVAELASRAPEAFTGFPDAALAAAAGRTALLPALLLLLHVRVPAAPFGAFEARERTDPRGGWQRPAGQTTIGWVLLSAALAARLGERILGRPDVDATAAAGLALVVALVIALVGAAVQRARPGAWIALALFGLAWLAAAGGASRMGTFGQALLLILACEPAWWSGRRLAAARTERSTRADGAKTVARAVDDESDRPARLFYDGDCGFCHRSVRFILAEELATPAALRLRFAPLGSDPFRACLACHPELDAASLPDSIVLELEDGTILTRSAAALEIASRLGGFWRLLALAGRLAPKPLLDAGYDGIARVRKRLFAQPKDACPILPPDLRARFDP
ncbi:MAG: DUF393 domain-containing protein [Deltaproteobacteria bacterium]|nr:DUF393 domain-containing protein [Deltaproteobacteria bacterium]